MKKMLIAIIILLLIVIFLLLYCNCRKKCVPCGDDKKITADSCQVFCTETPADLQGMIDLTELARISEAYALDAGKNTITDTGEPDALSMTFDLKKIKTLIWQIENYVCVNKCKPLKLGIRYYYVKYPPEVGTPEAAACYDGIDASEKNKHALVMVPAYYDEAKRMWRDFDIWNKPRNCYSPFPRPVSTRDSLFAGVTGMDGEGGDNHGGIGPPPAPGYFGN